MKNLFSVLSALTVAGAAFAEASVDSVTVRQDWPWSKNINVAVAVTGAGEAGVDLTVNAFDGETLLGEIKCASLVSGSLFGAKNGTTRFVIDPAKAFAGMDVRAFGAFRLDVSVKGAADPLLDRIEYRIVDLETQEVKDLARRDFYEHPETYGAFTKDYSTVGPGFQSYLAENETFVWTGVNSNNDYKTTKMAFKRIPAGGVVWTMGPAEDDTAARGAGSWSYPYMGESRVQVKLSKDYYVGVFELTQRQYELLTNGENPSFFTNIAQRATYPIEQVELSWQNFETKVNAVHNYGFKIPTEAQWEFAARAGYEGKDFPNGKSIAVEANRTELEGYSAVRGDTNRNGIYAILKVGSGRPNAYGLFNTLGNVSEWVADEPRTNLADYYRTREKPVVDPQTTSADGMFGNTYGTLRGGSFNRPDAWRYAARIATPDGQKMQYNQPLWGWRLCMEAE